jgi:pSer/pThr/pTyr-binding forkhead associated (FHA) protein
MIRRLTVITGPASGIVYELEDGQVLVIGRGADSNTMIDDDRMSRLHCRVIVDGDLTTVADAGSSSGTFVAGNKVDEAPLNSGDIIQVGQTQLRYSWGETEQLANESATIMGGVTPHLWLT